MPVRTASSARLWLGSRKQFRRTKQASRCSKGKASRTCPPASGTGSSRPASSRKAESGAAKVSAPLQDAKPGSKHQQKRYTRKLWCRRQAKGGDLFKDELVLLRLGAQRRGLHLPGPQAAL